MPKSIDGSPLLAHVQRLVKERPANVTIKSLAAEVGVTPVWLRGFSNGYYPNPSARIVEALYIRLTGKQLVSDCDLSKHTA